MEVLRIVTYVLYVSENKTSVEHQTTADQGTMRDVFEFLKQKNLPDKRIQENARAKQAKLKFRNDQAYSRIIFSITDAEKKLQKDVGEIDELKKLKLEAEKIYNQAKRMLESVGENMTVKDFNEATELIEEEEENMNQLEQEESTDGADKQKAFASFLKDLVQAVPETERHRALGDLFLPLAKFMVTRDNVKNTGATQNQQNSPKQTDQSYITFPYKGPGWVYIKKTSSRSGH